MASFSDQPVGAAAAVVAMPRPRRPARAWLTSVRPPRHLAALALSAPIIALAFLRFGASGRFVVAAFFIAVLSVLSAVDIAERRLPNRIVLPSAAAVLLAQIALQPDRALEWTLATIGAALVLLIPLLVHPAGLGMGDVKLALLLGAALGSAVIAALLIGFLAAAAYALVLLARHGIAARRQTIPLGPFLALGGVAALLL
jgi:leader peptidase (prepilin peptidase) / N-methyltransferase